MAINIKKNFQSSIKKDALIDYGLAALVPIFSAFAPSAFKLKGWTAFAVAYGLPIVAGMALGKRALTTAGVAMAAGHLAYEYGDSMFEGGIWVLTEPGTGGSVGDQVAMYSTNALPPNAQMQYINGEPVVSYPALSDFLYSEDEVNFVSDSPEEFESETIMDTEEFSAGRF